MSRPGHKTPKRARDGGGKTPTPVLLSKLIDEGFSPSYKAMLEICRREILEPSSNTMQLLQWCRLQLDIVRHAKEEQRLLDSAGAGVEYRFSLLPPAAPPPPKEPPPDRAAGAPEGNGGTVH